MERTGLHLLDVGQSETNGEPSLDAEQLCVLLARLDVSRLPWTAPLFPGLGPSVQPLFRGANAELLLVQWKAGQKLRPQLLGDTAMAVRPLGGPLELRTYLLVGRGRAELYEVMPVSEGELAGVPRGAIHSLRARSDMVSLHLCSPPVLLRSAFEVEGA